MKLQVLPYVSVEVDDRLRFRIRRAGDRLRVNLRAYLLSAADDVDTAVDTAGDRVRGMCGRAVHRVDAVVATVNAKIAPDGLPDNVPDTVTGREAPAHHGPHLRVVGSQEAS